MKIKLLITFIWLCTLEYVVAQDLLRNLTLEDTKSIEKYYLNVFSRKKSETEDEIKPAFDIDKQELLKTLRESIPLSGPIDPQQYIVGPGDVFEIHVWGDIPLQHVTSVTPEGSIIIPTHGIVEVSNITLEKVKSVIEKSLRKDYLKGEITITLLSPRIFTVNVTGIVKNPGNYYATPLNRVDEVLYMSNLSLKFEEIAPLETENRKEQMNTDEFIQYFNEDIQLDQQKKMSLRNIYLIRNNSDTIEVDLIRFYASGDNKYNPLLRDGDRVVVPNLDIRSNTITISGEVRLEGSYEYTSNDSLLSVFNISQGATKSADLESVDLYRLLEDTGELKHTVINVKKIYSGEQEDISLKPNDRIIVRRKYPHPVPENIVIKGEVKRPGMYPVVRNKTTLSQVIEWAGGFTSNAALSEAKVIRGAEPLDPAENNPDYKRLTEMRLSDLNYNQRRSFNIEYAIERNFVSVNFEKLFIDEDETRDIYLEDGDIVLIPAKSYTIYTFGQVAKPGYLTFIEGMDYRYYIHKSGGYAELSDESEVMIIKAGSKLWMEPDETELEPGDAIFVPREIDVDFTFYFNWFSRIVAVLGGVATIILLVTK
ncbi:SLBB domain-containing protein [Bacteroidota bacterium]